MLGAHVGNNGPGTLLRSYLHFLTKRAQRRQNLGSCVTYSYLLTTAVRTTTAAPTMVVITVLASTSTSTVVGSAS
jgi:hypothetical protein